MSRLKQLVTRLRRPDMREVAVAQVSDKYSEYPSNGLTPVKLAEILREAPIQSAPDAQERRHGP